MARLTFRRRELLYDAENYAHVEGDVATGLNEHARHQLMDIGDEGNVDRVTRVLNLAHAECVELLYPYTKEALADTGQEMEDVLTEPETYEIELSLPGEFSQTTLRLLSHLVHEYLVCRVLADWLGITNPEGSVKWAEKAAAAKEKARRALTSRRGKVRRRLKPW